MKKIVCFHLLNDYSGSPKVLNSVVAGLLNSGYEIDIVTSNTDGALSVFKNHSNVTFYTYKYSFSKNKIITAINYVYVQLFIFFFTLRYFNKDIVVWINTILPVGSAVMGYLLRKKVICHYHEDAQTKGTVYNILSLVIQKVASYIICVSEYQKNRIKRKQNIITIPNSLDLEFENASGKLVSTTNYVYKKIIMLSSLKEYKGVDNFVKLSYLLSDFNFLLIINDTFDNINRYFKQKAIEIPLNLKVIDRQNDTLKYYQSSSLVVNLSDKNLFVETFGLTALESMAVGLPCIVPTVGGIAELVEDNVNGYKIDVERLEKIANTIRQVHSDKQLYMNLSLNAKKRFNEYNFNSMIDSVLRIVKIVDNRE